MAHHIGSDLCYWLLAESGNVIARTSVQHVTREDVLNEDVRGQIERFDAAVNERLYEQNFFNHEAQDFYLQDDLDHDPIVGDGVTAVDAEYDDMIVMPALEADDLGDEAVDKHLNAELNFDVGTGNERRGRVMKRAKLTAGEPIGRAHHNPLFDTREYVVEFTDGRTENYFANVIAENMFAQVDSEGRQYQLLDEIVDHKSDGTAIKCENGFTISRNGNRVPKPTTRGSSLLVSWKDGTSDWIKLKDLKDSYPIQIAEYAIANQISNEPAFNWWVHSVLRKRNRIVSKVKSRYWKTTHKFGIRIPKSVEEALMIDEETGTDFWRQALGKEMGNVNVAWKALDGLTPAQARTGKM